MNNMVGLIFLVAILMIVLLVALSFVTPIHLFTKGRRRFFLYAAQFAVVCLVVGGAFEALQDDIQPIAGAAGTTLAGVLGEVPVNYSENNWSLARVSITPTAAVTGNNTNSGTINIRQLRAGAVIATVASLPLVTGTNLAAEVPTAVPISGTPVLVAGDVLDVQYVQIGTGLALPLCTVKAEIE